MRNISMEIEKVGYSGEFTLRPHWYGHIQRKYVSCYYDANLNKGLSAKIVSGQILTGDIQVIVK